MTSCENQNKVLHQIINYLLCRGDLNNQVLDVKPVSLWGLVSCAFSRSDRDPVDGLSQLRYGSAFDKFCFFFGTLCSILAGFSQPALALILG